VTICTCVARPLLRAASSFSSATRTAPAASAVFRSAAFIFADAASTEPVEACPKEDPNVRPADSPAVRAAGSVAWRKFGRKLRALGRTSSAKSRLRLR
jgi:hypothetical protein